MTQKYTVDQIETLGAKCKFESMGAERDGWIMPDGFGVDYAGFGQLTFEPATIRTDDPTGLYRSRAAVAAEKFESHDFGYTYSEVGNWIAQGDEFFRVCYAMDGDKRVQLVLTVKFVQGNARWMAASLLNLTDALAIDDTWAPMFSQWRHGGFYVNNVRYPSGSIGCVSNNFVDGQWRIVCDERRNNLNEPGDFTFQSREDAARAERDLVRIKALGIQAKLTQLAGSDCSAETLATVAVA